MRVAPTLSWKLEAAHEVVDARLLPLLEAIGATESLAAAVVACGVSYRAAWGLLRDYQRKLGTPLVSLERGRGARLAPAGLQLVEAHRTTTQRLARLLPAWTLELGPTKGRDPPRGRIVRLRVAASHDLALAALRDALPAEARLALEVAFMGSLHALKQFDEGRVDVGGFHACVSTQAAADIAPFRRLLRARRDRLIRFVDREQGFILPRGNPARVRRFEDLARKGLRFVNRQAGSGTRVLIDRLIAAEGIEPSSVGGYVDEEFTHAAVAATVASGAADAGFGLRAAAAQYGLAFVPQFHERYYLALRAAALEKPAIARLIQALQGSVFRSIVSRLPGYRSEEAGAVLGVEVLDR